MEISFKRGITALEIIIIVAIIGIILAVAIPQFSNVKENQVLKTAVSDVISALDKARSQTLSSLNSSEYGVHFASNSIIIFTGTAYSAGGAGNETVSIVSPASISTITLSGGGSDIYFNRLTGAPSKTGTVTISTTNYSKTITIGATGITSSN